MSNLVCKHCKSTDVKEYPPGMFGEPRHRCNSCGNISGTSDFVVPTVFDRITASPEALAEELVTLDCDGWWAWIGIGKRKTYPTREEAIDATVAKLKEVAE